MLTWEKIYQLQQMEKAIVDRKNDKNLIHKYNTLKKEKEIIQREFEFLKKEKESLETFNKPTKTLESEIEEIKRLSKEHEVKLYSGDITNNKELLIAKEQLDQYQTSIANLEDDLIKLMEEQEKGKEELAEKTNLLREKRNNFNKKYNEYQTTKKNDSIEISELEEELFKLKNSLLEEERDNLALYESLKGKYSLGVLAKLENGICLGCHMGVSFEVIKDLKKLDHKEPVYCNNCGRIVIQ